MAEEQWRDLNEDRGAGIDNREVKRCLYLMSDCIFNNWPEFKTHKIVGTTTRNVDERRRRRRREEEKKPNWIKTRTMII